MGVIEVTVYDTGDLDIIVNALGDVVGLDQSLMRIGERTITDALAMISDRVINQKKTAYNTPFHNYDSSNVYSPSHTKKRQRAGLQTNRRDLNYTGDMWSSVRIKERKKTPDIKITGGVYGTDSHGESNETKMMTNTLWEEQKNAGAKVMELSDKELDFLTDAVVKNVEEMLIRRLK